MDTTTKTATKSGTRTDATQAFRAATENGAENAREAFEKVSNATAEVTTVLKDSYSTAIKGAQDYNAKFLEFACANTEAAFDFAKKLSSVKTPSEFFELSTNHSRKQLEKLSEQTKELAALAQKATIAAAEPFKREGRHLGM